MKNIIFGILIGITIICFLSFSEVKPGEYKKSVNKFQPDKDLSLARVQKMSGKFVFINCEPMNDYDVAFEIKGITLGRFGSPDEMSNFVVKNALRIAKKDKKEFDGVVVGSGKVDIAIKFK